ncbi:Demethylmenaquinone methyltransferase protein [Marine Group I thaumarchaeote SCGC AAA799-E16]|uniref:Demethylmenaquinone methyltransferase protein n=4 Tax=Marine Group I TaxID=905826 RepID=A0A087S751_9ARCH|nr:Demethylmenaquinone methyltransferase protein [Marine Group I thaumarchaeote SCGC AAA799-E16]KFM17345.1 Demethylmenaquinone methyltransferase protein [Marine Group I thaumarchaeote SCGC AAA799-D11]KFM19365.1 Malonyl-acyl-carrier protein O-methyltransferase [Marine Group I thaumarchaeote SCGC RSA3]KFM21555.1 Demethylmenaquinone methyltransferase protein [Marine Group I thaumarchaeote SCGC AAA799-B03]
MQTGIKRLVLCLILSRTQNEIKLNSQNMHDHFSTIASKYQSVRTLDTKPIIHIKNRLKEKPKINMADIGCGDGRYSLEFLRCFDDSFYIHCVDYNENMLKSLEGNLAEQNITNFCTRQGDANRLPLNNNSVDCIVTFNAIHHFDVPKFLSESLRSLNDNGHLFIYTRLRNQNSRSIWGEHFPLFAEMEDRLYELDELESHIKNADMKIRSSRVFGYSRTSSLDRLVHQAQNNHYSTFALYDEETFDESLEIFQQNIKNNFDDLEQIRWIDENILFEIIK